LLSHPLRTIGDVVVRVEWTRYGREASRALRAAIAAAKGDEPLAPVTVVVPSNHVGVAARRGLASGAFGPACGRGVGVAAVTFVTPYRLAELLGASRLAATGRRPVSTPVIAAAMRAALAAKPGVFAPVAEHAATEAALVVAYRELRDLTPDALDRLAGTGRRARDVVRLHRAARTALEHEWYDEEDLMLAASEALHERDAMGLDLGTVVVHLPQRLSRHATMLVDAVGDVTEVHVLAGTTGDDAADREIATSLQSITATLPAPPHFDPLEVVDADRTCLVTTSDADDEVRAAVRAVVDAARAGTPLERIAILSATPQPYTRLVHEQLDAAEIPTNGAAVVPVAARMAGRMLLDLLELPEAGFRRQDVFAWLSAAPILFRDGWAPVAAWERLSRDAAVVAGRTDWDLRLTALAAARDERAADLERDPDVDTTRPQRARNDARRARDLRGFVLALVDELSVAASEPRHWGEHARWASGLFQRLLGDEARRRREHGPRQWPEPELRAAERVELALERLGALDAVEGPVALDVFTRTLQLELESDLGRTGRFGTGVLVGSVGMGVGLDLDLVVVLGLAEGTFPAPPRDDSLLPDRERAATAGALPLARDRIERQHRELLAALASAGRQLLGVPRGDLRRSSELMPSRWALDVASKLAGERWWSRRLLAADDGWIRHVPSFDAGLRRLGSPATDQEFRLRSLLAEGSTDVRDAPAARADPILARGTDVVAARRSDSFTRFDGNLAGLAVPSPVDHVTSPTRLETWAACPFDYLLRHVLGVEPVENPEEELRITPLDRGSLVHTTLERFVLEVLARPAGEQPAPGEPWSAGDHERLMTIAQEVCDEYERAGLTGRSIFWRRDRPAILADLARFLAEDDLERAQYGERPIAAELAFGLDGAPLDAVSLPLPDGRALRFRGKADRVDLAEDGSVRIIDYKTGRATYYEGLSADDPDQAGLHLQLAVYGAAARAHVGDAGAHVYAEYWFVSKSGEFGRVGYDVDDDVLERVGRTLGTVVGGIEAGVFPNHPTAVSSQPREFVTCLACDPDALGVSELRARWERKRADPLLARYADLAEPLLELDPDVVEIGHG
jgi:ATP-dependent helicase/nuclease subunit B